LEAVLILVYMAELEEDTVTVEGYSGLWDV